MVRFLRSEDLAFLARVSRRCKKVIDHPYFTAACFVVVGFDIAALIALTYIPNEPSHEALKNVLQTIDAVSGVLYIVEIAVTLAALGLRGKGSYFRDSWRILEGVSTLSFWISYACFRRNIDFPSLIPFRILAILKVLRGIKLLRGVADALSALDLASTAFAHISLLLFFSVTGFAAFGVEAFAATLARRCVEPITQQPMYPPRYCKNSLDGTTSNCPILANGLRATCLENLQNPQGGMLNFDNFGFAVLAMYHVASISEWSGATMHSIEQGEPNWQSSVWIYFVPFIIISSFLLASLYLAALAQGYLRVIKKAFDEKKGKIVETTTPLSSPNRKLKLGGGGNAFNPTSVTVVSPSRIHLLENNNSDEEGEGKEVRSGSFQSLDSEVPSVVQEVADMESIDAATALGVLRENRVVDAAAAGGGGGNDGLNNNGGFTSGLSAAAADVVRAARSRLTNVLVTTVVPFNLGRTLNTNVAKSVELNRKQKVLFAMTLAATSNTGRRVYDAAVVLSVLLIMSLVRDETSVHWNIVWIMLLFLRILFTIDLFVIRFVAAKNLRRFLAIPVNQVDMIILLLEWISERGGTSRFLMTMAFWRLHHMAYRSERLRILLGYCIPKSARGFVGVLTIGAVWTCSASILAVQLFGSSMTAAGIDSFQSFGHAFVTLFRVATGDEWAFLMYTAMSTLPEPGTPLSQQSLDQLYGSIFFCGFFGLSHAIVINLFAVTIITNYHLCKRDALKALAIRVSDMLKEIRNAGASNFAIRELALSTAVQIKSGANDKEKGRKEGKETSEEGSKEEKDDDASKGDSDAPPPPPPRRARRQFNSNNDDDNSALPVIGEDLAALAAVRAMHDEEELRKQGVEIPLKDSTQMEEAMNEEEGVSLLSLRARRVLASRPYSVYTCLLLFFFFARIVIQAPSHLTASNSAVGLDAICVPMLIAEIALCITAKGWRRHFLQTPIATFWGVYDCIAVLFLIINASNSLAFAGRAFIRCFLAFRPLRLLQIYGPSRIVGRKLVASMPSLFSVFVLIFALVFWFGMIGLVTFRGRLDFCSEGISSLSETGYSSVASTWGTGKTGSSLIIAKGASDCTGYYTDSVGQWIKPRAWIKPTTNFDNIGISLLTMIRVWTLEWHTPFVSVSSMFEKDLQPVQNYRFALASAFFLSFITIGYFFGCGFFVAAIVRFSQACSERSSLTIKQMQWLETRSMIQKMRWDSDFRPPDGVRNLFYSIAIHPIFRRLIAGCIVLNVLLACTRSSKSLNVHGKIVDVVGQIIVGVYSVELVVKVFALGLERYCSDKWNIFDATVTIISIFTSAAGIDLQDIARLLRVVRIPSLMDMDKTAKILFETLWTALFPDFAGGLFISFLFLSVCSGIAVALFGQVRPGLAIGMDGSFLSFRKALLTLFQISTGDRWDVFLDDCSLQPPYCSEDECGPSQAVAALFFTFFRIMVGFIFFNTLSASVIEAYAQVTNKAGEIVTKEQTDRYSEIWRKYDVNNEGRLHISILRPMLMDLSGCFEAGSEHHKRYAYLQVRAELERNFEKRKARLSWMQIPVRIYLIIVGFIADIFSILDERYLLERIHRPYVLQEQYAEVRNRAGTRDRVSKDQQKTKNRFGLTLPTATSMMTISPQGKNGANREAGDDQKEQQETTQQQQQQQQQATISTRNTPRSRAKLIAVSVSAAALQHQRMQRLQAYRMGDEKVEKKGRNISSNDPFNPLSTSSRIRPNAPPPRTLATTATATVNNNLQRSYQSILVKEVKAQICPTAKFDAISLRQKFAARGWCEPSDAAILLGAGGVKWMKKIRKSGRERGEGGKGNLQEEEEEEEEESFRQDTELVEEEEVKEEESDSSATNTEDLRSKVKRLSRRFAVFAKKWMKRGWQFSVHVVRNYLVPLLKQMRKKLKRRVLTEDEKEYREHFSIVNREKHYRQRRLESFSFNELLSALVLWSVVDSEYLTAGLWQARRIISSETQRRIAVTIIAANFRMWRTMKEYPVVVRSGATLASAKRVNRKRGKKRKNRDRNNNKTGGDKDDIVDEAALVDKFVNEYDDDEDEDEEEEEEQDEDNDNLSDILVPEDEDGEGSSRYGTGGSHRRKKNALLTSSSPSSKSIGAISSGRTTSSDGLAEKIEAELDRYRDDLAHLLGKQFRLRTREERGVAIGTDGHSSATAEEEMDEETLRWLSTSQQQHHHHHQHHQQQHNRARYERPWIAAAELVATAKAEEEEMASGKGGGRKFHLLSDGDERHRYSSPGVAMRLPQEREAERAMTRAMEQMEKKKRTAIQRQQSMDADDAFFVAAKKKGAAATVATVTGGGNAGDGVLKVLVVENTTDSVGNKIPTMAQLEAAREYLGKNAPRYSSSRDPASFSEAEER